jgi:hypothetical protein
MAGRKGSRSRKGGVTLFRRVYSPLNHLVSLSRNVSKNAFRRVGKGVNLGLGFVQNTGRGVTRHANKAANHLVYGVSNKKQRRNTRRSNRK